MDQYTVTVLLAASMVSTFSFAVPTSPRHYWYHREMFKVQSGTPLPPDEWFDQKLDHLDPGNTVTWKQRYQVNDTFFQVKRNAPVFLMIGGEGEAEAGWLVKGAWITYAEKFGALCIQLEHRFYGKSRPTKDMSTENLKYLSVEQALADLAYFIEEMTEKYELSRTNRWIAFGGSYAGSLAAWLRLKYPHLVHAAISSSAPLLAIADFKQYDEVVQSSLATSSQDCVDQLKTAVKKFNELVTTQEGVKIVNEKFKLCSPLDVENKDDIVSLALDLSGNIESIVQYNNPTENINIDQICYILNDRSKGSPLDRYAAINDLFLSRGNNTCLRISYEEDIRELKETSWTFTNPGLGVRQWMFQTCSEFGFFRTGNYLFGPSFNLTFNIKQCEDVFGEKMNEKTLKTGIERTNLLYGGLNIDVSRVLFDHGTIDPWHALGVTSSRSDVTPAILIEGTSHCAAMLPPVPSDPPQLIQARREIMDRIRLWLGD